MSAENFEPEEVKLTPDEGREFWNEFVQLLRDVRAGKDVSVDSLVDEVLENVPGNVSYTTIERMRDLCDEYVVPLVNIVSENREGDSI